MPNRLLVSRCTRSTNFFDSKPSRHIVPPNLKKPKESGELSCSRKLETSARIRFLHQPSSSSISGILWRFVRCFSPKALQPGWKPATEYPSLNSFVLRATSLSIALSQSMPGSHVDFRIGKVMLTLRQSMSCVQPWTWISLSQLRNGPTRRVELSFNMCVKNLTSHGGVCRYGNARSEYYGQRKQAACVIRR